MDRSDQAQAGEHSSESETAKMMGSQEAASLFNALEKRRKILVFKTIKDGIESKPRREEASFENCVQAYTALQTLVHHSSDGSLEVKHFVELRAAIELAGGVIAPGLKSEGEQSLGVFLDQTFLRFQSCYEDEVFSACMSCLNTGLRQIKPEDAGTVFQTISSFFNKIYDFSTEGHVTSFNELTSESQVDTLATLEKAICKTKGRIDSLYESCISAISSYTEAISNANSGHLSISEIDQLRESVTAIGGTIVIRGKQIEAGEVIAVLDLPRGLLGGTINEELIDHINTRLGQILSDENSKAALVSAKTIEFLTPISHASNEKELIELFNSFAIQTQKDLCDSFFDHLLKGLTPEKCDIHSLTKAFGMLFQIIEQAKNGSLTETSFDLLQEAIEDCGGSIAPKIMAKGPDSIQSFKQATFSKLNECQDRDVVEAVFDALNAQLRATETIDSINDILIICADFIAPITNE